MSGRARAHAARRADHDQLALDRQPPRVLLDGPCPVCDDHDGWWIQEGEATEWEPCFAHEPLPDHVRKETPRP